MLCPRCNKAMEEVGGTQFTAYACASCGGAYYPHEEFRRHLAFARTLPVDQLPLDELFGRRVQSVFATGGPELACPVCAVAMEPFNYGYDSNVFLGKCPTCGGLWVERGQINQIARYLKGHPVLDHVAEGLVDEERQKQRFDRLAERAGPKRWPLAIPLFTFVPVSNADELPNRPLLTWLLIGLNVLLFFLIVPDWHVAMALVPKEIAHGRRLYSLVSYQFAHAGILHLLGNMLFLRAFGDRVEDRIGRLRFLASYLLLGVVAGLVHVFSDVFSKVPSLGASGAISGVMGMYLVLFPVSTIRVVVFYWTVPVPALLYLVVWFVIQTTIPWTSHVAVAAHLGGFLAGMLFGGVFRSLRVGLPARAGPGANHE
jgi:membrane associated rhomboid family serine protease